MTKQHGVTIWPRLSLPDCHPIPLLLDFFRENYWKNGLAFSAQNKGWLTLRRNRPAHVFTFMVECYTWMVSIQCLSFESGKNNTVFSQPPLHFLYIRELTEERRVSI